MQKKSAAKQSSKGAQCKIDDSTSWIVSFQHFTAQNTLGINYIKSREQQIQYVLASTFDGWMSIRSIEVKGMKWIKIFMMKMAMPVVNSYIEFNEKFEPQGVVLAYIDGSMDYSPWQKIEKLYAAEINAGKRRKIQKSFPQIIHQSCRPAYINTIIDESQTVEQAFMLETISFLHKKGEYIYVINFKGEFKIFRLIESKNTIQLVSKIDFSSRVLATEFLIGLDGVQKDSILVTVCFLDLPFPVILELSLKTTQKEIQQQIQFICKNFLTSIELPLKEKSLLKLVIYDPFTQLIIICNESNKIQFYSFVKQQYKQKDYVYITNLQKGFSVSYKDNIEVINDISVKEGKLAIICKHSFTTFDMKEDFLIKQGQRLSQQIQFGKLVALQSENQKILLLLKKKFNYLDPEIRKSTTLHLFPGK